MIYPIRTYEEQRAECQRFLDMSDAELAAEYRCRLRDVVKDLTDLIEGRCTPLEDIVFQAASSNFATSAYVDHVEVENV